MDDRWRALGVLSVARIEMGDPFQAVAMSWLTAGGVFGGLAAGVPIAAPARFLAPESRAIGLGLFCTLFYAGMAVLPRLAGAVADRAGTPEAIGWTVVALLAATTALLAAMRATSVAAPRTTSTGRHT